MRKPAPPAETQYTHPILTRLTAEQHTAITAAAAAAGQPVAWWVRKTLMAAVGK